MNLRRNSNIKASANWIGSNQDFSSNSHFRDLKDVLDQGLGVVKEFWEYPTTDWVSSVFAADIDGDGDIEVLAGSRDKTAYILSKRGGLKWKFANSQEWTGAICGVDTSYSTQKTRVIVGSRDNKVYAFDEVGRPLWTYTAGHVIRQVLVQDINNDGRPEIIVGSEDRRIYALSAETGGCLWNYETNGWIRTVFAADIDGDGEVEVLAGSGDKHLYVIDNNGYLKWKHNTSSKIHTISAIDLDEDGIIEILIGSDAKDLTVITPDRKLKWKFKPENRILSTFVIKAFDGRENLIVAGSEDKHIYFLDHTGNLLWKHYFGYRVFSIYVTDLNRDGLLEVIVGSEKNCISVLQIELVRQLRNEIVQIYERLDSPNPLVLPLSPQQHNLLRTSMNEHLTPVDQGPITKDVVTALHNEEYLTALSLLVQIKEKRIELLWYVDTGHVRTICLARSRSTKKLDIIAGTDSGELYAYNSYGTRLWQHQIGDRIWMVQAGDIELDGQTEIIVGAADGRVHVIRDGKQIKASKMDDWVRSLFLMNPENGEGSNIVVGSESGKIHIVDSNFHVLTETINIAKSIRALYAIDLNKDGIIEIVAGVDDNYVYCYTKGGALLWRYRTQDRIRGLSVKDIDNDGDLEILIGSEDRNVYVLDKLGNLKWRYLTAHRILDIDATDIDDDGKIEVLAGGADGCVYVFSCDGDLLWQYKVADRVRGVRAGNVFQNGNIEIVVGSEDQRIYLLAVVDGQIIHAKIEDCWKLLRKAKSEDDLLSELLKHPDAYVRGFALTKLVSEAHFSVEGLTLLQNITNDSNSYTQIVLARTIDAIYGKYPDQTRRLLDKLSAHPNQEVRLAFVERLPSIVETDADVGFEYLDRFTRDSNKWIRRTVVRNLHKLVESAYSEKVFRLLQSTSIDKEEWVRQESGRVLAHYFDIYTQNLISGVRTIFNRGIDLNIMILISSRATKPVVQNFFNSLVNLSSNLNETSALSLVAEAVKALELCNVYGISYAADILEIYKELFKLHQMRTLEEIALYKYRLAVESPTTASGFEDTIKVLQQLEKVPGIVKTYLKREGLGDRLASLLEATTFIERTYSQLGQKYFWSDIGALRSPERQIFELLLVKWRTIVTEELTRLRGKAELRPELKTKSVHLEEKVAIWLEVHNIGRSPADDLNVTLLPSSEFEILGNSLFKADLVPSQRSVRVEFTISPSTSSPQLFFRLIYDDADARDKELLFGDRLELHRAARPFVHIKNPYIAGTPIHSSQMFYGRTRDLEILSTNLGSAPENMIFVLYGQRRSGKSSLLYQLSNTSILEPHITVYLDMQRISYALTTGSFLYHIALAIYRSLVKNRIVIDEPDKVVFEKDLTLSLDFFLDKVEKILDNKRLIVMIDEFEIIESKVTEHVIAPEIFHYLRSLMQHRRQVSFLLTGVHSIDQLTADYWSVFFNIAHHHRLARLEPNDAITLITEPVKGVLEYDPYALEKIRDLTADQPYLIQLLCHSLVMHCNDYQKNYVTINDVNIVLHEVMETGKVHFRWVWERTTKEEQLLLSIIAQEGRDNEEGSLSLTDIQSIYQQFDLSYVVDSVRQALKNLINKDIVESIAHGTRFKIPVGLIRMWLREEKYLRRVLLEANQLAL